MKLFYLLSHFLVALGVWLIMNSSYSTIINLDKNEKIQNLFLHKKLSECSISFGTYIATKGKHGLEFIAPQPRETLARDHQEE